MVWFGIPRGPAYLVEVVLDLALFFVFCFYLRGYSKVERIFNHRYYLVHDITVQFFSGKLQLKEQSAEELYQHLPLSRSYSRH